MIIFQIGTNGKSIILGVPVLKHSTESYYFNNEHTIFYLRIVYKNLVFLCFFSGFHTKWAISQKTYLLHMPGQDCTCLVKA